MDRAINAVMTLAVVVLCILLVRREFGGGRTNTPPHIDLRGPPVPVDDWRGVLGAGIRLGRDDAPIQIAVFEDIECPFCRRFHETVVQEMKARFGDAVAFSLLHYPLERHRFARIGAQAIECVEASGGRAEEFLTELYRRQDSLGLFNWTDVARSAGVQGSEDFDECLRAPVLSPRIDLGVSVGNRIGITGTPTVVVEGLRFRTPPQREALAQLIDSILASR